MKKYLIALTLFIAVAVAFADVWVYQSDGTRYYHNYSTFDSLSRVAPGTLALSQSERIVPCEGETFNLDIYANQSWTASVSDASRIQLSKTHGNGNDVVTVTVAANKLDTQVYDTITVRLADGTQNAIHLTENAWQDDLTVNPLSQNFFHTGGTFKVGIESNTSWTVDNNADWVSLDKTSGSLNDSITVTVSPSATEKTTQAILTVTTPNKATLHSVVTRIDGILVNPSYQTSSPLGGTLKMYVSSNTSWTVSASEPWVTFDNTSGSFNDSIIVNVAKSDTVESTSAIITATALKGKKAQCKIIREGDSISTSISSEILPFEGGSVDVAVTSNTDWTVYSDKSWVTLSKNKGSMNDSIVVTVAAGSGKIKDDEAIISYKTSLGKVATLKVVRLGYTGVGDNVTDINGKSYPTVWIYGQNWMAENLKCDKYDTESEAYNASWLISNTVPTSKNGVYTPYYTDATDNTKWLMDEYAGNLTGEQIAKLGYLYNWAAVVGVENGQSQTIEFTGNRQGICPNGWHVPSRAEWQALYDYIYKVQELSENIVGKYLKTTSGWYNNGNGTDSYGFAALPSGYAYGSSVYNVGYSAYYWAATPCEYDCFYAYYRDLIYGDGYLFDYIGDKVYGRGVRCIKD